MSRLLAIGLCLLQIAILVQCNGFYSIIAPGTLRSKSDYHVTVSIHDAPSACKVKVGLKGAEFDKSETVEIPPKSSKTVMFQIPKLKDGDYNLTAEGLSGIEFKNTTKLNFAADQLSIYVQTDKATYKPGDKVQYRVLVLDKNTRPANIDGPVKISINDAAQNLIKQINDVELTKGVYSGELQLSEFPVLGSWNIEVSADGSTESKNFEVDKYVLPKFEVQVEAPKDVAIADGKFQVTIRSKYTYGKPVKGTAVVTAKLTTYYYGDGPKQPEIVKNIKIDGKGRVEFDIADFKVDKDSYTPPITFLAIVEEELTGLKQNSTATVTLHREKYQIQGVDTPYSYNPGKPVIINVVVKNLDGSPVQDTKNPVTLNVSPPDYWRPMPIPYLKSVDGAVVQTTTVPPPMPAKNYTSTLDKDGMAKFEIVIEDEGTSRYFSIKAHYLDSSSYITSLSKYEKTETPVDESLKIVVQTKKPALGNDVSIKVQNGKPIPYFVYVIMARGDIIKSEFIEVPENRNYHVFKITPTFEMIPNAKIFIHYVVGTDLMYTEETINFEKDFENSISIEAPVEAKPGADVEIKVNTDPDSYVGLLGVDQSVLLLKSGNDLQKDKIFQDLNRYDSNTPYSMGYGQYPGSQAGIVTMSNANYPFFQSYAFGWGRGPGAIFGPGPVMFMAAARPSASGAAVGFSGLTNNQPITPVVRQLFPETWIYDDMNTTEGNGITLSKKVPDTITSWVVTGFSLNPKTGLALTEEATKLKVFQPFFISTNLPYSVKRGEVISIPVVIFNYLDKNLEAEVTLDNPNKEFDFTEATNEVTESASEDVKRTKTLSIPSNSGQSVSFMIRPNVVGPVSLKISAISAVAGDAIQQSLKVEPEGVTTYVNKAIFMNLNDVKEKKEKVDIAIPKNAVEDSEYIELSVVGDLLGPTIKNLDKLIRMPYGCGEQNMVNFVPNILVLKYLTAIKQLTPAIEEKAKKFLEIGYQRELQYKHDDGSYSAFGKSDKSGSTWLTAYVVKSFHQAIPYTVIDQKIIEAGLQFLADTQLPSGEFPEVGKVIDSSHSGGSTGLTAYVLLAFLENVESADKYKDAIEKCLTFLEKESLSSADQYSLAISGLALQLGKREESAKQVFDKLNSLAKEDGDRKWWSKTVVSEKSWYGPVSVDVEMTAYIVLAMLKDGTPESVLPSIRWLVSQRNSQGGFPSTQDTVIGLEALTKFAAKTGAGTGKMDIDFVAGPDNSGTIKVNPENSLILQTHVLPKTVKEVEINAKGTGSSLIQVSYRYNIAEKDSKPSFNVMPVVKKLEKDQLSMVVCTEFIPIEGGEKSTSMSVVEVSLPSGYTANTDSFDKIMEVDGVKRVDTKNSDSVLQVYLDGLTTDQTCLPFEATKSHAVAKQKPSPVVVYDYYDNNKRSTEYYEVVSSLCDICQGDDCGAGCAKKD